MPKPGTAAPPAPQPEYMPTATIKDLMLSVIDPSADIVWLSVTTVVDEKGLVETMPKSDEEWTKVRHGAVTLMEAANLLMIPGRRVARPGEKSETPGVELEPEEMDALIAKDRAAWNARANAPPRRRGRSDPAIDAKDGEQGLRARRADRRGLRELPQAVLVSERSHSCLSFRHTVVVWAPRCA